MQQQKYYFKIITLFVKSCIKCHTKIKKLRLPRVGQLDLEQWQSPVGCEWHIFTSKYTAFVKVAYFQKSHTHSHSTQINTISLP